MIDVRDEDVVLDRRTADGRFCLFHKTDLAPGSPIAWSGVILSTSGDGHGIIARLDDRYGTEGWTTRDLLEVALARQLAEQWRRPGPLVDDAVRHLLALREAEARRYGQAAGGWQLAYTAGREPSPYAWTSAWLGPFELPLCPDAEGQGEGVTPEQVLIVIDQLLGDAAQALPREHWLREGREHAAAALAAEVRRLAVVRAQTPQG